MKTKGQKAYEKDCKLQPMYLGLSKPEKRRQWDELPQFIRESWERNPTARKWRSK